jgi:hypothetical protein
MQEPEIKVSIIPSLDEPVHGHFPNRLPPRALLVGIVYWVYGPGWVVKYSISSLHNPERWVLWEENDLGGDWGFGWAWSSAKPLASCPQAGVPCELAARLLLRTWWCHLRDRNQGHAGRVIDPGTEPWNRVFSPEREGNRVDEDGPLSFEALQALKEDLWPSSLFVSDQILW